MAKPPTRKPAVTKRAPREPKDKPLPKMPDAVIQKDLAKILGLTDRRVRDMVSEGILERTGRSEFPIAENVKRYLDYKVRLAVEAAAPPAADGLRLKREEQLAIRIGREDRQLITLQEAIETVDAVVGHFMQTIAGLPARLTRDVGERKRIEAQLDEIRQQLSDDFGKEARALETGLPVGEADEEDDA